MPQPRYDPLQNGEQKPKKYYKLSFDYTFKYDEDVVSFALCVPYTYSQLLRYIKEVLLKKNSQPGLESDQLVNP